MDLMEAALVVKHNAERIERKRFQRRYGAFWKCDVCGAYLGQQDDLGWHILTACCQHARYLPAGYAPPPESA